jgi:porin
VARPHARPQRRLGRQVGRPLARRHQCGGRGRRQAGGWTSNSALFIGLDIDAEKLVSWRGASFGFAFLQFNGADSNADAGSVAGYNGIVGLPPFQRSELFRAWYAQEIVKDVLKVRIGRMDPTVDFGNVLRPVTFTERQPEHPGGERAHLHADLRQRLDDRRRSGYYNVGNGATVTFTPTQSVYVSLGAYDGNRARGVQTGLNPPLFNGYYFTIGEIGTDWRLGEGNHPGSSASACGVRRLITAAGVTRRRLRRRLSVRLAADRPRRQRPRPLLGDHDVLSVRRQQLPDAAEPAVLRRRHDGVRASRKPRPRFHGLRVGLSRLNPNLFARPSELMIQAYIPARMWSRRSSCSPP